MFDKLAYIKVPLDAGEFSLMDRKVVNCINSMPERDRLIRGLRAWVGFKQTGIPYVRPERFWGRSTNNFTKNLKWAKKAIFSFSFKPLDYISNLAVFFIFLSLISIIVYIILSFFWPAPRGFLTLLIIILFFNAVQLTVLSIISEYLGRIFEEIKARLMAKVIILSVFITFNIFNYYTLDMDWYKQAGTILSIREKYEQGAISENGIFVFYDRLPAYSWKTGTLWSVLKIF